MKIVKNKDFERDESVKRHVNPDSPLRFPMHALWAETHEERIRWLYYENLVILEEYISAILLYDIAKVKFQEKDNKHSFREHKVTKEGVKLWQEVSQTREEYRAIHRKYLDEYFFKYHLVGRDKEWELEEDEDGIDP